MQITALGSTSTKAKKKKKKKNTRWFKGVTLIKGRESSKKRLVKNKKNKK